MVDDPLLQHGRSDVTPSPIGADCSVLEWPLQLVSVAHPLVWEIWLTVNNSVTRMHRRVASIQVPIWILVSVASAISFSDSLASFPS